MLIAARSIKMYVNARTQFRVHPPKSIQPSPESICGAEKVQGGQPKPQLKT